MSDPQGNVIFLVCKACEAEGQGDFGVKLAIRSQRGWYEHLVPSKQFDAWLNQHSRCAGRTSPDHFALGYQFALNHDQKALEATVKAVLS